jgi:hypothetical protein
MFQANFDCSVGKRDVIAIFAICAAQFGCVAATDEEVTEENWGEISDELSDLRTSRNDRTIGMPMAARSSATKCKMIAKGAPAVHILRVTTLIRS